MSNIDEKTEVKNNAGNTNASVSKSKQKRIDREAKLQKSKRDDFFGNIIGIAAILVILGAVVASIVSSAVKNSQVITPSDDFSKYLADTGFIKGVDAPSITVLCDYNNIEIPRSEVEMSDEDFEEEKNSLLESHEEYSTDTTAAIKDGDKINLDYVGSVDGVEFEGGNSNGAGYDLVIGSGSFIPGFEDQLIGHKIGENFDIDVTFPENYSEDLAGKDAVFNCTINGIYVKGTFDDAFVAKYLAEDSNGAKTVEEYRKYLDDTNYDSKAKTYVSNYVYESSTLNKFPKKYLHHLKCLQKYSEQQSYEYMNQLMTMYGQQGYSSFEEYTGMSPEAYDASLDISCRQNEKELIVIQAIAAKEGISVTDDEIKKCVDDMFGEGAYEQQLDTYKKPYLAQMALNAKVISTLVEKATVK